MPGCSFRPPSHLGLRELVDHHLDLGVAPGRANMTTLVASALAGGLIDDADALRAGGTARIPQRSRRHPWAPSCEFSLGPRPSTGPGEPGVAGRAWQAGAGPGVAPDHRPSTICETYGLAKEGARHHGYTGRLSPAAGCRRRNRRVLMCRLREGRANTARGAAHFLA